MKKSVGLIRAKFSNLNSGSGNITVSNLKIDHGLLKRLGINLTGT